MPDVIIFGTGDSFQPLPIDLRLFFKQNRIAVEIMNSVYL